MPPSPFATKDAADGKRTQRIATWVLYTVLVALAIWIIRSFIPAIVWALVIAIVVWPLLQRLSSPKQSAARASVVALLLTTVVGLFVVLPFALLVTQVLREAHQLIHWIRDVAETGFAVPPFVAHLPFGNQITAWWQTNLARPLEGSPAMDALRGILVASFVDQDTERARRRWERVCGHLRQIAADAIRDSPSDRRAQPGSDGERNAGEDGLQRQKRQPEAHQRGHGDVAGGDELELVHKPAEVTGD